MKIQFLVSHTGTVFQVSEYLKKQMVAADQEGVAESDEVKRMLEDHDKLVEEIFQHEDKDKNGFISHDEFSGPKHDELWKQSSDQGTELAWCNAQIHGAEWMVFVKVNYNEVTSGGQNAWNGVSRLGKWKG